MRAMLSLAVFATLALWSTDASAQLLYVEFKSDTIAKRYSKHLSSYRGRTVVLGEPHSGIKCTEGNVNYTSGAEAKNSIYVADPNKPGFCPYEWKNGIRVKASKGKIITFAGDDMRKIGYVDRLQTLAGLAQEYNRRDAEIERLRDERDEHKKGMREWFNLHGKIIGRTESLMSWLQNVGYPAAAKKLAKVLKKERKVVAKEAMAIREQTAFDSIRTGEVPERLEEVAGRYTDGRYAVVESQHLRITYVDQLSDHRAEQLIELGEKVIEAFRKEFVDPYLGDDYPDRIPDTLFQEFYFGPEDVEPYEHIYVEYYGLRWGRHKEKSLTMSAKSARVAGRYLNYGKLTESRDLDGTITHVLGHTLCDLHFNGGRGSTPAWLSEALGYYMSFSFLGRNSLTCFNWAEKRYDFVPPPDGEKTVQSGLRGHFNELARSQGPTLESLSTKTLAEINDADFAKAWSAFDWIARTQGKRGQKWLRATCLAASDRGGFMKRWRKMSEETFEVEGEDVFAVIEREWRDFAENEQMD